MTTKTATKIIADHIASEALDQGLSLDDLRSYNLMRGDIDYIVAEYPSEEYPAEAISAEEWRVVICEVERHVREYA